jgi:two-component system, cell cycle sensor histidine kinase and response regulator CckA
LANLKVEFEQVLSHEQAQLVLHDLRVHQVQLEAQNEELRKAHSELQEARARYFDLYDLAPVGYFSLSESGVILQLNLSVTTLLGLAKSHALRQPLFRFVHPEDKQIFLAHRKQLFDTGAPQVCELRMLSAEGSIWVRFESSTTRASDGAVHWRATVSDITERRRAEEALRVSETRYRVLFENSRDALLTLTPPNWRFSAGNAAAVAMFGMENESQLRSQTLWDSAPERQPDGRESSAVARAMIDTAMREGVHLFEWTYQGASAQSSTASVLLNRIELDGQPVLQATIRDESETKALQARMAQADRLATMGMLAAGVAHEINNPLTYVIFNLERLATMLAKPSAPGNGMAGRLRKALVGNGGARDRAAPATAGAQDLERCVQQALDGVYRIKSIARGLGTFSRIEDVEMSLVSLNTAIDQAAVMAVNEIRFRATLVKDLGDVPSVLASEGKLAQVFLNLLVNAAHSIDEGDPGDNLITIRSWASDGKVFAEVSDTGCGIPKADEERIFEPFFTTKKGGMGSGLGLPICRTILSRFAGTIGVHSAPGGGSRFLVCLPSDRATPRAEPAAPAVAAASEPLRGRILIVDDEPAIRSTMQHLLEEEHDVVTTASGLEARALLERDRDFDLVLCDLMMPQMSGMELHAWLATHDPLLAKQMVFMSGGAFTPKAMSYLARVDNLRLEKPFDMLTLMRLVAARVTASRRTAD